MAQLSRGSVKKIALIAFWSALPAGCLYTILPSGWCGSCPRRSLTIGPHEFRFGMIEWYSMGDENHPTWVCLGPGHVEVPLPAPVVAGGIIGGLVFLEGIGYATWTKQHEQKTSASR